MRSPVDEFLPLLAADTQALNLSHTNAILAYQSAYSLRHLFSLKVLDASFTLIRATAVANMARFHPHLVVLRLRGAEFSTELAQALCHLESLKFLDVRDCTIPLAHICRLSDLTAHNLQRMCVR